MVNPLVNTPVVGLQRVCTGKWLNKSGLLSRIGRHKHGRFGVEVLRQLGLQGFAQRSQPTAALKVAAGLDQARLQGQLGHRHHRPIGLRRGGAPMGQQVPLQPVPGQRFERSHLRRGHAGGTGAAA